MKIGIVGGGVVGRATARCFIEHVEEVRVWDCVKERRTTEDLDSVFESDLVFLCLPSPQKAGSMECDTLIIEVFVDAIPRAWQNANIVLRSTVPVGTTRRLAEKYNLPNLVHSPEFLTARCAMTDAQLPARNIIGYTGEAPKGRDGTWSEHEHPNQCYRVLRELYKTRFPGVSVYVMRSDESEMVKLGLNSFFAVKVAYFNELRTLCDARGLDWDSVLQGMLSDGRIAHAHTKVPGPDGKRGFGGACLPKDLADLIHCVETTANLAAPVMRAAYHRNEEDRKR